MILGLEIEFKYSDITHRNKNQLKIHVFQTWIKQKISNDRQRITALPVICTDPEFDFPLQIISKQLGVKWKGGEFEEIELGDIKVKRKKFEKFTVSLIRTIFEGIRKFRLI